MTAIEIIDAEVRDVVRREGLDPIADPRAIRTIVDKVVAGYDERSLSQALPPLRDPRSVARMVLDAVAGFGPLQPYLDDPTVEEIWINEPSKVFIARHGRSELTTTIFTATEIRDLVERMLKSSGRRIDLSAPFVDAMLPDGSRLHVVIPDITAEHWAVNIRKFVVRANHLDELVGLGTLTAPAAGFLDACVMAGLNVLVAGGTQAGKTTMLNCLTAAVPARERVITCEEVFELPLPAMVHTCAPLSTSGSPSTATEHKPRCHGSARTPRSWRTPADGPSSQHTPTTTRVQRAARNGQGSTPPCGHSRTATPTR